MAEKSKTMPPTAEELLAAFKAGYQALGRLLELHRDLLLKIVNDEIDPKLRPRGGASDVVQDAFCEVLGNIDRSTGGLLAVKENEKDLRAWLRRVALNALRKKERDEGRDRRNFRKDQPIPEGLEPHSRTPSPSSTYRRREKTAAVETALTGLAETDRVLFRLKELHDWPMTDLAALLEGQSTDAGRMRVKRRLADIRLRLSERLRELGG